jgi:hypothetical protein
MQLKVFVQFFKFYFSILKDERNQYEASHCFFVTKFSISGLTRQLATRMQLSGLSSFTRIIHFSLEKLFTIMCTSGNAFHSLGIETKTLEFLSAGNYNGFSRIHKIELFEIYFSGLLSLCKSQLHLTFGWNSCSIYTRLC